MLLNTFSCNKKEKTKCEESRWRKQRRTNLSRIRFKTIHEIQIVFGRQFAFVSLKGLSPQKCLAKMTRQWRISLTTFFRHSENLLILKLNLWLKSTTSFFMKTLSLLNVFLLVSNYILIMLIVSKQVMDIINAMPSNMAPGIDKVPTRVL